MGIGRPRFSCPFSWGRHRPSPITGAGQTCAREASLVVGTSSPAKTDTNITPEQARAQTGCGQNLTVPLFPLGFQVVNLAGLMRSRLG
jgi:hypothetical protein